jgi:hypothetical protein
MIGSAYKALPMKRRLQQGEQHAQQQGYCHRRQRDLSVLMMIPRNWLGGECDHIAKADIPFRLGGDSAQQTVIQRKYQWNLRNDDHKQEAGGGEVSPETHSRRFGQSFSILR